MIFKIKFRHASAQALAVESREEALGETKTAIVGARDLAAARANVTDAVMGHEDDIVEFSSFLRLDGDDFVEIFS